MGSPLEENILIDKYVPAKDRQGKYRKVPKGPSILKSKELVGKQFCTKGTPILWKWVNERI